MTMVLIHGRGFAASCWERMLPYLTSSALAVDLPGRGATPADLDSVTISDCAQSVIGDMDAAGIARAVIVGHSMAGLTMTALASHIPERIESLVFISCVVPAEGQCAVDSRGPEARKVAENIKPQPDGKLMTPEMAAAMFCNDMDDVQTTYTLSLMVPDAKGPIFEPVSLNGFARDTPHTYVKLTGDLVLAPPLQDQYIANIEANGGNCQVVPFDSAHMAMISQPQALAEILNGLVS